MYPLCIHVALVCIPCVCGRHVNGMWTRSQGEMPDPSAGKRKAGDGTPPAQETPKKQYNPPASFCPARPLVGAQPHAPLAQLLPTQLLVQQLDAASVHRVGMLR